MSAKYCKEYRCSDARRNKPCNTADECPMFKWDIDREKGDKEKRDGKIKRYDEKKI